jgi:hypothetical protein
LERSSTFFLSELLFGCHRLKREGFSYLFEKCRLAAFARLRIDIHSNAAERKNVDVERSGKFRFGDGPTTKLLFLELRSERRQSFDVNHATRFFADSRRPEERKPALRDRGRLFASRLHGSRPTTFKFGFELAKLFALRFDDGRPAGKEYTGLRDTTTRFFLERGPTLRFDDVFGRERHRLRGRGRQLARRDKRLSSSGFFFESCKLASTLFPKQLFKRRIGHYCIPSS